MSVTQLTSHTKFVGERNKVWITKNKNIATNHQLKFIHYEFYLVLSELR